MYGNIVVVPLVCGAVWVDDAVWISDVVWVSMGCVVRVMGWDCWIRGVVVGCCFVVVVVGAAAAVAPILSFVKSLKQNNNAA